MMLRAWGTVAWGIEPLPPPAPLATLIALEESPELVVLARVEAYQGLGAVGDLSGLAGAAWGTVAWGTGLCAGDLVAAQEVTTVLRYGERAWVGAPDDPDAADRLYEGRLADWEVEVMLPLLRDGRGALVRGQVRLDNADGALDDVVDTMAVQGRRVTLHYGPPAGWWQDFAGLAATTATGWAPGDAVAVGLGPVARSLDAPLVAAVWDGGGGAGGEPELAGTSLPGAWGSCRRVPVVVEDKAALILRAHHGRLAAWTALRDRGQALDGPVADHPTRAALAAAAIPDGGFATCLAEGLARVAFLLDGYVLDADVEGDAEGGAVSATGEIALRLITGRAGLAWQDVAVGGWRALPAGPVGLFAPAGAGLTVADALDRLMAGQVGWWGDEADGRLAAGLVPVPETQAPAWSIDEAAMSGRPEIVRREDAIWRAGMRYARHHLVADGESPGPAAWRADPAVRARSPGARDLGVVEAAWAGFADADAAARRLIECHGPARLTIAVPMGKAGLLIPRGSCGVLAYPRYGLAGGRMMWCRGHRARRDGVTVYLWG